MFTEVIALTATKKVIGLTIAAGLAASATVAGTFGTSGSASAPFPSLAPVVVEADLGSMLRFGGGSETGAAVEAAAATDTQVDLGIPTAVGGTVEATLGGVLGIPQATSGVAATAEAEASTTTDVQTTATAEAALETEVALEGLADVEAVGLLGVSLR